MSSLDRLILLISFKQHADVKSDIWHTLYPLVQPWTLTNPLLLLHRRHTCSYMKRGEKPEGYRQMRPKTFPASNYSGNSQQMLQEIRNSLRNLSKPSDPPKVDIAGKMISEDPRQQGRCSNPKNPHHKALQEIRKSLLPFANESNTSGSEVNKHKCLEPPCAGFEEVRRVFLCIVTKTACCCKGLQRNVILYITL